MEVAFAVPLAPIGRAAARIARISSHVAASPVKRAFAVASAAVRPSKLEKSFFGDRTIRYEAARSFTASQMVVRMSAITAEPVGTPETLEYRVFIQKDGKRISPWHDIPLYVDQANAVVNGVFEIPKNTKAKMEVATDEKTTPIKQDTKKGALRYYTYGDMPFNYGCLPQTWEDPNHTQPDTDCGGDNDPVDVVEIGEKTMAIGTVAAVKVLGVLGLIDEGECDWKVIAIRTDDPKASQVNDLGDVEKVFPGVVDHIRTWFREYKVPDGKPLNDYAFGGEAKDKAYAMKVIAETHKSWADLKAGKIDPDDLSLA
eukprot:tig00001250_g7796.t1